MKTILHVTPKGNTLYTMPDDTFAMVEGIIEQFGARRGIESVLSLLPAEVRATVTKESQNKPPALAGRLDGSIILISESSIHAPQA